MAIGVNLSSLGASAAGEVLAEAGGLESEEIISKSGWVDIQYLCISGKSITITVILRSADTQHLYSRQIFARKGVQILRLLQSQVCHYKIMSD